MVLLFGIECLNFTFTGCLIIFHVVETQPFFLQLLCGCSTMELISALVIKCDWNILLHLRVTQYYTTHLDYNQTDFLVN